MEHYKIYLENYPYDLTANLKFADLLVKLGSLEEAKTILENAKKIYGYPENYSTYIKHIFLKILCAEGKYKDAYIFIRKHLELIEDEKISVSLLFICKQINVEINFNKDTYLIRQIKNYNENAFFEHITKHKIVSEYENGFAFLEDFPIKDVYYQIRNLLPHENRILNAIHIDFYYFKYNNCGYRKDRNTDYFTAVVLHDTNNVITMYPSPVEEVAMGFIDLNPYFKKEEEYTRTRKMSQIEKFNRKYNK